MSESPEGVFVISGIMASGKSTVAQLLAERFPKSAHVRGDAFRRMIVSGREDTTPDASKEAEGQLHLRHRLAAASADAYFEAGFTTVVQDVILGEWLGYFVGVLESEPIYVVVLAPTPEAVAERERKRKKRGYGEWSVEELDRGLRNDTPRLGLWLDTSGQTPEEIVAEIVGRRKEARVR